MRGRLSELSERGPASAVAEDAEPGGPALLRELRRLRLERSVIEAELVVQRSRSKSAAESERKRIERNVHDGAQQRLLTVVMAMRMAEFALPGDPSEAAQIIADAAEKLMVAIADLRDLAAGSRPAVLVEEGLIAAVTQLARCSAIPVEIHGVLECDLDGATETTAYFVIAEALSNVAKHARAAHASVAIAARDASLTVEIRDDGVGGASTRSRHGTGLCGMAERVGVVDGTLDVLEVVGGGTLIRAVIPTGSK